VSTSSRTCRRMKTAASATCADRVRRRDTASAAALNEALRGALQHRAGESVALGKVAIDGAARDARLHRDVGHREARQAETADAALAGVEDALDRREPAGSTTTERTASSPTSLSTSLDEPLLPRGARGPARRRGLNSETVSMKLFRRSRSKSGDPGRRSRPRAGHALDTKTSRRAAPRISRPFLVEDHARRKKPLL
jgi:hypothetical protein